MLKPPLSGAPIGLRSEVRLGAKVEGHDNDKDSSLLRDGNNYANKKFIVQAPGNVL